MKKYNICVYGIAKNEEKFVNRFMDSIKEVDKVYILDTGSTDNTVELFKKRGAIVHQKKYKKFNFDKARNDSLKYVPKDIDICICLDIDDCIEPGFVKELNKIWADDISQVKYEYLYSVDENDKPIVSFYNDHIHARNGFKWIYPIHEILKYNNDNYKCLYSNKIKVIHRPDHNKDRYFYLDLLEKRVEEYPDDRRNIYLLARQYINERRYEDSIRICQMYLNNLSFTYIPERAKIKYYLAKCYRILEEYNKASIWAKLAIQELPDYKDSYIELLMIYYDNKEYQKGIDIGLEALNITKSNPGVLNESIANDGTLYDYLSLCYYELKDYDNAIKYIDIDIEEHPKDERLKKNREIFIKEKDKII